MLDARCGSRLFDAPSHNALVTKHPLEQTNAVDQPDECSGWGQRVLVESDR
jgi:hypothetical protein